MNVNAKRSEEGILFTALCVTCYSLSGMLLLMQSYECDQCGACCKGHLIVEAYELDVLRESQLISVDPHYAGRTVEQALEELQDEMKIVLLTAKGPCPFLAADNTCSIHPTRPNVCVAMQPGDEQCQEARADEGLPPLEPKPNSFRV